MKVRGWVSSFSLIFALLLASFTVPIPAFAAEESQLAKATIAAENSQEEELRLMTLFADTFAQIRANYAQEVSQRELMEAAIKGMMSKLDQYSNYIAPEELDRFKSGIESEFGGVGIQVSIEEGVLKIISPIVGSPAYRAGLMAGDKITAIEGKSTKGITLDDAVKQMKGKIGSTVHVTVEHPDSKSETVALTREIVRVDTVMGDLRNDDDSWNFFLDPEKKIAYIRVTAFSRHTTDELRDALKKLIAQNMKGLILDLRFNPGGLLTTAIEVSDLFISSGRIVSTASRSAEERSWDAHKEGTFADFPMVVLVNHYSASASEIVAACLQDHKRAVIIGERTWGKGSVQNIIELEDGKSALKLTTAGYQRPSGANIHRADDASDKDEWGVKPDSGFELTLRPAELTDFLRYRRDRDIVKREAAEKTPAFVDRQLEKALQHLTQKPGSTEIKAAKVDLPQDTQIQAK